SGQSGGADLGALLGSLGGGSVSGGWEGQANTGRLDETVAPGAREKYTRLLGDGKDTVTLMVYMCGTDLESRSGMGTADLQEMLAANLGENVNLLVYTGGCSGWRNNQVSSAVNQIWQVKNGRLACLERDLGAVSMTDSSTLYGYIRWCAQKFPANRYGLILWDHGGGSVSGYGYDEKFASSGSMSLFGVDQALGDAGVKFDFVGFDACLMATAETALMLTEHADYLIASEETEPGVGWYYTDWLTALGKNPSMPTIEIGRNIVDSFVETCAEKCRGQLTTLSVVDLAELEATLPQALADFSRSASRMIEAKEYETVAGARNGAREFAQSSKIDQVDLVHLARNMGTPEGKALAESLLGAVKYNRTSSNMTNAYGISIYFPYRKSASVNQ
ncbi:MAG: peptidase C11, partial [Dysosmobacter sp.]|nr:peptidase C11 [Dysosmobacter sp.]